MIGILIEAGATGVMLRIERSGVKVTWEGDRMRPYSERYPEIYGKI